MSLPAKQALLSNMNAIPGMMLDAQNTEWKRSWYSSCGALETITTESDKRRAVKETTQYQRENWMDDDAYTHSAHSKVLESEVR